ncbi:conserved hypothetical protein [Streptomyces lividans TK24]|nr:conserved hypothetical protein [Streptomyces lividans TK24]
MSTPENDQADGPKMRRGRRLAVDVGDARIGVASCDPDGILATPVETVPGRDVPAAHRRLRQLVAEYEPIEVVVGLPPLPQGGRGAGRRQGQALHAGAGQGHRARPGPAGRRTHDDGHRQPGTARLRGEVQEGPVRHRPGRRRDHPPAGPGIRTGVRQATRRGRRSGHLIAVR